MCGDHGHSIDSKELRKLEESMPQSFWDSLIKMPIGWQPPPITIEDIANV